MMLIPSPPPSLYYSLPQFLPFDLRIFWYQVDEMFREAPIKNGMFDYTEFTRILKHGAKDKDEQ